MPFNFGSFEPTDEYERGIMEVEQDFMRNGVNDSVYPSDRMLATSFPFVALTGLEDDDDFDEDDEFDDEDDDYDDDDDLEDDEDEDDDE